MREICESADILAQQVRIPEPFPGDLLAILNAGAYCHTMSSQYNSRLRAAEVLVDGNRMTLIRRRETTADLVRNEIP